MTDALLQSSSASGLHQGASVNAPRAACLLAALSVSVVAASSITERGFMPSRQSVKHWRTAAGNHGDPADDWRFLHAYPKQYLARRLNPTQHIVVDGNLNEPAWLEVPFSTGSFEDIAQPLFPNFVLPQQYATQLKVRWDADFLYIGAQLGEPFVTGVVTGHNPTLSSANPLGNVPYYDNDFEVFVDVSGTNYYYKEFEMNFLGATYDVLWRVPDSGIGSVGVPCCGINSCPQWCQNSSYPYFGGKWSMYPRMHVATARYPGGWTAEVAMPLRGDATSGGLLDGAASWGQRYDPNHGARFWYVDFARAEHPFFTDNATLLGQLCPVIQKEQPTLLGTDQWSCYFEYVWQACGGHRYMHNPDTWGVLQFTTTAAEAECKVAEWPARYVLAQVYQLQIAFVQQHGAYATDLLPLAKAPFCTIQNGCNPSDLQVVFTDYRDVFNLHVDVNNSATTCVRYATQSTPASPTGGPCFTAKVLLTPPGSPYVVTGTITEARFLDVTVTNSTGTAKPCLQ